MILITICNYMLACYWYDAVVCRYKSRCTTRMVVQEVEEDYPDCQVKMTKTCTDSQRKNNTEIPSKSCGEVSVRRCQIGKRKVRKAQPDTRCARVPSKTCVKHKCGIAREKCEDRVRMVKEFQPQESCTFIPRRVCQEGCSKRMRRVCKQVEGGIVKTSLVCNGTIMETP